MRSTKCISHAVHHFRIPRKSLQVSLPLLSLILDQKITCRIEVYESLPRVLVIAERWRDGPALSRARPQVIHAPAHPHAFEAGEGPISHSALHVLASAEASVLRPGARDHLVLRV